MECLLDVDRLNRFERAELVKCKIPFLHARLVNIRQVAVVVRAVNDQKHMSS